MFVDIIIPVKFINKYIYESIPYLQKLDYKDYGIIIFPDTYNNESFDKTRIIPTGNIGPAEKRDLAIKYSQADILAFIDDDAYPRSDWLKNAVKHFKNSDVGAVGGPAITPANDSFLQKVSGAVFLSKFGGGNPDRYWPIGDVKEIDDWPSVNLLVRRDIFEKIGGFDSCFWPGEDTKLCLDICKHGKKIIYDPAVVVWHHRRGGILKHLKQIGNYGLHRGYFAKRYPENSRKPAYFIPSLFFLFLLVGFLLFFINNPFINLLYFTGASLYFLSLVIAFFEIYSKEKKVLITLFSLPLIFCTHIWYGIKFLQGFVFKKKLKSKLRK